MFQLLVLNLLDLEEYCVLLALAEFALAHKRM